MGITAWSIGTTLRLQLDRDLDVGSGLPQHEAVLFGEAVRFIIPYASWVHTGVSQVFPYRSIDKSTQRERTKGLQAGSSIVSAVAIQNAMLVTSVAGMAKQRVNGRFTTFQDPNFWLASWQMM